MLCAVVADWTGDGADEFVFGGTNGGIYTFQVRKKKEIIITEEKAFH